jgi:short-subunit dehydrogenase
MELGYRQVVVTGAAGGIGAATCRLLARHGARLVLTGRNQRALDQLAAELGGEVVVADLMCDDDVARLADVAAGADALVLNAGVGHDPPLADVAPADIDAVLATNLRAPMVLATAFAQAHLAAATPGAIVMVGSVAGVTTTPGTRLYNATKFGLRGFALSLHQELHGTGITATHVAPGFIRDAGMFADSGMELPPGVRTSTPDAVATAVMRAIRRGSAEVFVAPTELRLAATLSSVAPAVGAAVLRRLGAGTRRPDGRQQDPTDPAPAGDLQA